jgi:phosphate transport system substrate-binding protein
MSVSKRSFQLVACLSVFVFLLIGIGCNSGGGGGGTVSLHGAGATFPNPLYQKWLSEHGKLHPNVRIDYQSIGSGGGIKQLKEQTVDFGASDTPMKDEDLKSAPGEIIHVPTVLGAVVMTYNLADVKQPLRFTAEVIADIYLGKIKKWNDAKITADNPGLTLPATDITVVYRSDGSGTSAVFTDYLSKVSAEWKEKVGTGTSPKWPIGLGAKGNEGVTGQVKNTPNTIGYTELAYAVQNKLPVGLVKNQRLIALRLLPQPPRPQYLTTCGFRSQTHKEHRHIRYQVSHTLLFTKIRRMQLKERCSLIFSGGEFTMVRASQKTCSTRRYRRRL